MAERSAACPLDFLFACFSNYGFKIASRISKGIGHTRCKHGNVTDSPANHLKEIFRSHL